MRVVYKYHLGPVTDLDLPANAYVVSVAAQNGTPTLWVDLNTDAPTVTRTFVAIPTGSEVEPDLIFVGSAHGVEGWMVFHIYERK